MWLQATLTREDLQAFADQILPLRIVLGDNDDRRIYLGKPRKLELLENRGMSIETHARVHWPVLGMSVPIEVPSVSFVLEPHVTHKDGEDLLAFRLVLTDVDLTHVPGLIERPLVHLLNEELAKKDDLFVWDFTKTLDFKFPLPDAIEPARRFRLSAAWGEVKVTTEGLTLLVSFRGLVTKSPYSVNDSDLRAS